MTEEIDLLFLVFVEDVEIVFGQIGNESPLSSVTVTGTMTSLTETWMGACAFAAGRGTSATARATAANAREKVKASLGRIMNDSVNNLFYPASTRPGGGSGGTSVRRVRELV